MNELLAHEAAGWDFSVFALRPPNDTHFQPDLARLRAPVHYLQSDGLRAYDLWAACQHAGADIPDFWRKLGHVRTEEARDVFQGIQLAREVLARGLNHLHAHFASLPATVARLAAHFADIPFSFTAHAKDIFVEGISDEGLRRKLLDAALVVTVSAYNVSYLQARYGAAASRVRRIYNGLDLSRFAYRPLTSREPMIVAVGRVVEKKGFSDLIDACMLLAAQQRRFRCEIIGAGELDSQLRDRIARLGLERCVAMVGPRPTQEVIAAIQRAAVFVAPSVVAADGNRDGLPTTVLEAMALGTPVITTDVTGLPEAVSHEISGLIVPQRDPSALAMAIGRLLDDQGLAASLARTARHVIEREFDASRNAAILRDAWSAVHAEQAGAA